MKKPSRLWGCVLAGLLILVLLGIGGVWWFFRSRFTAGKAPPSSPVQVFLLSPSSGDDMAAGDYVPVALQASAPEGIASSELFVDGQSLGAVSNSPESASWTWQAWPVGVHTLSAHAAAADGQMGESQTVIVNVLKTSDTTQIIAGEGQTLAKVGEKFGVPPDQMAGANPHINPSAPLKDGQPVNVPVDGGAGGEQGQPPGGGNAGGGGFPLTIIWNLKLTKPADKSYCYISTGDGTWDKIPKPPFNFFESLNNLYTQLFDAIPQQPILMQAQCWGWLGGGLQYLGQGETQFDAHQHPDKLMLSGQGFQLIGVPQIPQNPEPQAGMTFPKISPPYGPRQPKDTAECLAHGGNSAVCDAALNAPLRTEIVLEWEWQPGLNWPGGATWVNDINGYHLYEIDPSNNSQKYMQEIDPAAAKAAALPLPWGARCYGVEAYAEGAQYGGMIHSKMTTYCPGQPPATQQLTLTPTDWITFGGTWIDEDCSSIPAYYAEEQKKTGFGNQPGEVLVGSNLTDSDDGCYDEASYSGAELFPQPVLPPGAVVQKALLRFSTEFMVYFATGVALGPEPNSCVATLGAAQQNWGGLDVGNHSSNKSIPYTPLVSVPAYGPSDLDVTPAVSDWIKHPANNHGFVLKPVAAVHPHDGTGRCFSGLGNFQLEIDYFAP